jgi:hypothetical protein
MASLMREMHQFLRSGLFNARKMDCHGHGNAESFRSSCQRAKRHRGVNCHLLWHPDVALACGHSQGPDETGCIPRGKQLFRLVPFPLPPISINSGKKNELSRTITMKQLAQHFRERELIDHGEGGCA